MFKCNLWKANKVISLFLCLWGRGLMVWFLGFMVIWCTHNPIIQDYAAGKIPPTNEAGRLSSAIHRPSSQLTGLLRTAGGSRLRTQILFLAICSGRACAKLICLRNLIYLIFKKCPLASQLASRSLKRIKERSTPCRVHLEQIQLSVKLWLETCIYLAVYNHK